MWRKLDDVLSQESAVCRCALYKDGLGLEDEQVVLTTLVDLPLRFEDRQGISQFSALHGVLPTTVLRAPTTSPYDAR